MAHRVVQSELGSTATRGAGVMIATQGTKLFLQMCGMVLLARILAPSDFGIIAMVTAIIGVGELLRDFGLSSAAVQARTLTERQQSNLFWVNSAIGALLCATVFFLSGYLADFYDEEALRGVGQVLSITFLMNGVSTQFRARLSRAFRFGSIALIDITAVASALGVALLLGVVGMGYWALVGQLVTQSAIAMIVAIVMARWLPGLPNRGAQMGNLYRFGGSLMATQLLGYVSRNADSVLVGLKFGPSALGFYDRAFQLLTLPLNQLQAPATQVALPVLSRLQDDKTEFDRFLLRGQMLLLHLVLFAFTVLWLAADSLVVLVFGSQWEDTIPILRVLIIGGIFQAAGYTAYWVFLAKGLPGQNLRYALVSRSIVLICIAVGATGGPVAIAAGYSVGTILIWPLALWWLSRVSDAPTWSMFTNGLRAVVVYVSSAACAYALWLLIFPDSRVSSIIRVGILFVLLTIWVLVWRTMRNEFAQMLDVARTITRRKKK